jgi:hypothetical protein
VYDAEIPWFRVVAVSNEDAYEEVCQMMETILKEIRQEDACPITQMDEKSTEPPDIDLLKDKKDSRLCSWSEKLTASKEYESFRYPSFRSEGEREPPFKASWKGLEEQWPRVTDPEGFLNCVKLPPIGTASNGLERVQMHYNVEVSWNIQGTVLYVSSDETMANVSKAIEKLDGALRNLVSFSSPLCQSLSHTFSLWMESLCLPSRHQKLERYRATRKSFGEQSL